MRQFDVYENPDPQTRQFTRHLVLASSHHLKDAIRRGLDRLFTGF